MRKPARHIVLAAGSIIVAFASLADGPASTRLQLVHLSSLATGYLLIGATAVVSIRYLMSSPRRENLDRIGGALARAVVLTLSVALVSGAAWSSSFSNELWSWEPRLTSSMITLLAFLGYPAVRRLDASNSQCATRCAVVAVAAAGQIPFLWASLLIWARAPTESAALIPDVWALEGGSGPIRLAALFGATIVSVALLVAHQMKRALASDRRALVALEAAIMERRNEAP